MLSEPIGEIVRPQELSQQKNYPGVHFEPGIHPTTREQNEIVMRAFENGDTRTHIWNKEVGQRLKESDTKLISIDGLSPPEIRYTRDRRDGISDNDPFWIWEELPDRPRELNKEGKITVVIGDIYDSGMAEESIFQPMANDTDLQAINNEFINLTNQRVPQSEEEYIKTARIEGTPFLAIGALISAAITNAINKKILTEQKQTTETTSKPTPRFSRRKFLRGAAGVVVGGQH